jgi:hypothetical protein
MESAGRLGQRGQVWRRSFRYYLRVRYVECDAQGGSTPATAMRGRRDQRFIRAIGWREFVEGGDFQLVKRPSSGRRRPGSIRCWALDRAIRLGTTSFTVSTSSVLPATSRSRLGGTVYPGRRADAQQGSAARSAGGAPVRRAGRSPTAFPLKAVFPLETDFSSENDEFCDSSSENSGRTCNCGHNRGTPSSRHLGGRHHKETDGRKQRSASRTQRS